MASVTAFEDGSTRRRSLRLPKLPKLSSLSLDTILTVAATIMVPLGAVLVGLGWYGASHTPFLFEQIPYLISGGLLGIGVLFAGAALYVGTWIMRLTEQQRVASAELLDEIRGLREELGRPALAAAAGATDDTSEIPVVRSGLFVATPTGTMFHRPDCTVVAERDDVREVDPTAEDLAPCKLCDPLDTAA